MSTLDGLWHTGNATSELNVNEVRRRIVSRCVVMRSIWFPTLAEYRAWDASHEHAFVLETRDGLIVGARIVNASAARLLPVVRLTLQPSGNKTTLNIAIGWLTVTKIVGIAWGIVLMLWLVALVQAAPDQQAGGLFWWSILAGGSTLATLTGWVQGRKELRRAVDHIVAALEDDAAGADDW
ncbi:MAG: hypothetical protein ACON5B_03135 [Myxococcota bacterium]